MTTVKYEIIVTLLLMLVARNVKILQITYLSCYCNKYFKLSMF